MQPKLCGNSSDTVLTQVALQQLLPPLVALLLQPPRLALEALQVTHVTPNHTRRYHGHLHYLHVSINSILAHTHNIFVRCNVDQVIHAHLETSLKLSSPSSLAARGCVLGLGIRLFSTANTQSSLTSIAFGAQLPPPPPQVLLLLLLPHQVYSRPFPTGRVE